MLRASFAVAKCVACVSTVDLRTRRNLGIVCVRKDISCDQKQLRSRTASTWIYLHAHRDMFLQNDCCDLAPPDTLMHTKMLRFRPGGTLGTEDMDLNHDQQTSSCDKKLLRSHAAGTLGSHSVRNETSSCDKTAAFSRRKHTWISLRAQRDMFLRKDCCDSRRPQYRGLVIQRPDPVSTVVTRAHVRPLLSREPVTRNLVTAPLLTDCRPLERIRCWGIFMDCCVRAPCVLRRSQMCRLRFDLRTRKNRVPATHTWNFPRAQRDIMRAKTAAVSHRKHMDLSSFAQRHVSAKPWKRWVLKQGLNYVKSRIRERPRPKPYSWTAAFVLRASFAVSKAGC